MFHGPHCLLVEGGPLSNQCSGCNCTCVTIKLRDKQTGIDNFSGKQCCRLWWEVVPSPRSRLLFGPQPHLDFIKYFSIAYRHLRNLSVQNILDCISENFRLNNFPCEECAQTSLEKWAVPSPHGPLNNAINPILV